MILATLLTFSLNVHGQDPAEDAFLVLEQSRLAAVETNKQLLLKLEAPW